LAVAAKDSPALTRLTASSLNSAVYELPEIFISYLPKVTSILRHLWKTKFRGKLITCDEILHSEDVLNVEEAFGDLTDPRNRAPAHDLTPMHFIFY